MAQRDENELVLTDKQIGTFRRLALNELHSVEKQIAGRANLPRALESQWYKDKQNQRENLLDCLDALNMPEPTRTDAAG